ncbi:helix-turn-helix domain-containing protein [Kitasatospora brasiliensis]|uniref:helix-turn-helix domain-containing protein n=1 Tax=Kitasatospora brasiliensis TaxID=3058040 RepID=UPI0029313BA6|nr:helix-turn-helix domain-containing protein [Kitasatospora sp. K002]
MDVGQSVQAVRTAAGFGELLRVRRERIGLTQQCLADHATLSVRAIRDMESGRVRRPRNETVRLLADALRLEGRSRTDFEEAARRHPLGDEPVAEPAAPPVARGAIVGREMEAEVLADAFAVHGDRLVSLVGLGGVGKSRLALEVARRLHLAARWSVRWVACGGGSGGPGMPGMPGGSLPWRGPVEDLVREIGDRPALLVLDGADGGVDAGQLDGLFRHCPGLRVLITAREARPLPGGQVIPLAPLPVPAPELDAEPEALAQVGAVRLLLSHLSRLRPGYTLERSEAPAVAELCRHLDGLPGALERAAGWALVQSTAQLVARLAAVPLTLAAPPVVFGARGDVRDEVEPAIRNLTDRQRSLLDVLVDEPGDWSGEDAVVRSGWAPQACLETVYELLSRGLIRSVPARDGLRFTVLNLCRRLVREESGLRFAPAGDAPLLAVAG